MSMKDWTKTGPDAWRRDYAAPFYARTLDQSWVLGSAGPGMIASGSAEDPRAACDAFVVELGKALVESVGGKIPTAEDVLRSRDLDFVRDL